MAGHIAKLTAFVSSAFGILLLLAYLQSEGAPMPASDSSFTILITLTAAIFIFILLMVSGFLFLPAILKWTFPTPLRPVFPGIFDEAAGFSRSIRNYLVLFAPFLVAVLSFFFCFFRGLSVYVTVPLIASVIPFLWCLRSRCRSANMVESVFWFFWSSFLSFVRFLSIYGNTAVLISKSTGPLGNLVAYGMIATLGLFLLVLHFIFVCRPARKLLRLLLVVLLGIVVTYPGLPFLGGLSLRFTGTGGGVPVRILVKTMTAGSSDVFAEEIAGCLIIGTGSEVLLKKVSSPGACRLSASSLFIQRQVPTPYVNVVRLSRSDVLKLSGWTDETKLRSTDKPRGAPN